VATIPPNPPWRGATGVAGAHHEAVAVPEENETLCEPRERASAIIAILLALFLALVLVAAAMCSRQGDGFGGGGAGMVAGAGFGNGTGSGVGPGSGTGSGADGTGPGAADDGRGLGASGDAEPAPPLGDPEGTVVGGSAGAAESPAEVPAVEIEPPKFGFTAPEAPPKPIVSPPPAAAPGTSTGRPTRGASGAAGGGGSEFMGVKSKGKHVVYVIDHSGSMVEGSRFAHTKLELKRSIEALPENGSFLVVFFDDTFEMMPPGRMVPATARNKSIAKNWIDGVMLGGGTDPSGALDEVLPMNPETVFLMTDGGFEYGSTEMVIERHNADRKTSINTIAFHERQFEEKLKEIAARNRGDYRYVPPPGSAGSP
jgi:hypothetical protein